MHKEKLTNVNPPRITTEPNGLDFEQRHREKGQCHGRRENVARRWKKQSNERVEVVSVHYILDGSYQPVKWVVFPLHAFYVLFRTFHVAASLAQRYKKVNAVSNPKPAFEKRRC